jgi:hypothetical protein
MYYIFVSYTSKYIIAFRLCKSISRQLKAKSAFLGKNYILRVDEVRVLLLVLPGAELLGGSLFAVIHPHRAGPAQQLCSVLGLGQRLLGASSPKMYLQIIGEIK